MDQDPKSLAQESRFLERTRGYFSNMAMTKASNWIIGPSVVMICTYNFVLMRVWQKKLRREESRSCGVWSNR